MGPLIQRRRALLTHRIKLMTTKLPLKLQPKTARQAKKLLTLRNKGLLMQRMLQPMHNNL